MDTTENDVCEYQCDTCLKCFSRKDYLKKHLERKIKCTSTKICYRCNKEFPKKANLIRHLNRKNKCDNINDNYSDNDDYIDENPHERLRLELINKDKEIEILKLKLIIKEKDDAMKKLANNTGSSNQTINNTNNGNITNQITDNKKITSNINNTYINYVTNNYPNAKNLEDCMKQENVTKDMIKKCKKYIFMLDGSYYLLTTLLGTDEDKRPIHCTDSSRNNFIYKTKGNWKTDIGGKEIESQFWPIVNQTYGIVHSEKVMENIGDAYYVVKAAKEINPDNVTKVCNKTIKNAKTAYLAKNNTLKKPN